MLIEFSFIIIRVIMLLYWWAIRIFQVHINSTYLNSYDSNEHHYKYCKLQKLRGRKVLRFIGFYRNVGKTFAVLLLKSMKTTLWVYISTQNGTYKISKENFCGSSKIRKTTKVFFHVGFVVYGITQWKLWIRILENKDTCIILMHTYVAMVPYQPG